MTTNAGCWEQAEYKAKAGGEGVDEKSILEALKQSFASKVKELEEKEVCCILTLLRMPEGTRVNLREAVGRPATAILPIVRVERLCAT